MNEVTPEGKLIVNRLKASCADVDEMQKVIDIVTKTLALGEADALEAFGPSELMQEEKELIAELRKAAQ